MNSLRFRFAYLSLETRKKYPRCSVADDKNTAGAYVREIASNGAEAIEPALPSVGRLGVSYDEGGEGLGDPAQVAQASA